MRHMGHRNRLIILSFLSSSRLIFNSGCIYFYNGQDASCKRNAFMMLIAVEQSRALDYLSTCIDQVQTFNEILQLVIVELVHKVCRTDVTQRARFIRVIYNLLESSSAAVRFVPKEEKR